MNLGTWRIVIIVVLVVTGVAILANGFDDADPAFAAPTATGAPSPDGEGDGATDSPAPSDAPDDPTPTPPPRTSAVLVKVFNGTTVTGLAGVVHDDLVAADYVAPNEPANAPTEGVTRTRVYFRGGPNAEQNRADATYVAETFLRETIGRMPKVEELSSIYTVEFVPNTVTVVVLVGQDYADAIAAG